MKNNISSIFFFLSGQLTPTSVSEIEPQEWCKGIFI